ncbi:hypothetical protein N9O49_02275 [Gammaproteobacteria bacterium]|nr:hypothetical protein [Gammaproteobacteria bacterium]
MNDNKNDEFLTLNILKVFIENIQFIFVFILLFASITLSYSFNQPNIYRSDSIVSASSSFFGSSFIKQSLSRDPLSALGLTSGGSGEVDKYKLAIKNLSSRNFLVTFYNNDNFLIDLYCTESPSLTDSDCKKSVVGINKPNFHDFLNELNKNFDFHHDPREGFLYLGFKSKSPLVAKRSLELIILEINEYSKTKELAKAEKAYRYLEDEISKTNNLQIQRSLSSLIEEQARTKILGAIGEEFVFTVIETPHYPEVRFYPSHSRNLILGVLLGFSLSILFLSSLFYYKYKMVFNIFKLKFKLVKELNE